MDRTRKQPYYYINDRGEIKVDVDNKGEYDNIRFRIGNYFLDPGQAREAQNKFFSLFSKGQSFFQKVLRF